MPAKCGFLLQMYFFRILLNPNINKQMDEYMKDNKKNLINVDKDTLCFLMAVAFLTGIGGIVQLSLGQDVKAEVKKENVLDVMKCKRDTVTMQQKNIMDLISTKQK